MPRRFGHLQSSPMRPLDIKFVVHGVWADQAAWNPFKKVGGLASFSHLFAGALVEAPCSTAAPPPRILTWIPEGSLAGNYWAGFGRSSATLGPKTPLDRRGSSCSEGCTNNLPGRQILRPFRGAQQIRPDCFQVPRLTYPALAELGRPWNLIWDSSPFDGRHPWSDLLCRRLTDWGLEDWGLVI